MAKIEIFCQNLNFWPKLQFLVKISICGQSIFAIIIDFFDMNFVNFHQKYRKNIKTKWLFVFWIFSESRAQKWSTIHTFWAKSFLEFVVEQNWFLYFGNSPSWKTKTIFLKKKWIFWRYFKETFWNKKWILV